MSGELPTVVDAIERALQPVPDRDNITRALARAKAEERLLGLVVNPVHAGRFVLLDRLGQGAMGVVYSAYDPKLDRKVAIKLVDASRLGSEAGDAHARLEREARAAAGLSHPNVVTVYDVGLHEGNVFLAMEHVRGVTLTAWCAETQRSWVEIVGMFIGIGRGLAAAHAAGIVHRDFKPDNVLVGQDGRPRVADFGLAQPVQGWNFREQRALALRPDATTSAPPATTGSVCGTPAYMAPEQFVGLDVGPPSDQFGFCVALFEALFGFRPFRGASVTDLAANVSSGTLQPLPAQHRVPRAVVRLVSQGLRVDPQQRHASVATLVDQLEGIVRARKRRPWIGVAAGVAVMGLVGGYQASAVQQIDPCDAIDGPIDAAWGTSPRRAAADALGTQPDAMQARVLYSLDEYAEQWRVERRTSCEATAVHGAQSDFALELSMACLDRAALRMRGIVDELARKEEAFRGPEQLTQLLAPLSECRDIEQLERAGDRMRRDGLTPQEIAAHDEGLELVAQAEARSLLGRPGARALLEAALTTFQAANFETLQGIALYKLGELALDEGDLATAASSLARASALTLATAHDAPAAEIAVLSSTVALESGDVPAARLHLGYATGLIARIAYAPTRTLLEAMAQVQQASIANRVGENLRALQLIEVAAPKLAEQPRATAAQVAQAYALSGTIRMDAGDVEGAVADWAMGLARLQTSGITESLDVAYQHGNLAIGYGLLHRYDDAALHYGVAAGRLTKLYGEDHVGIGMLMANWGWLERERGDLAAARVKLARADAIFAKSSPDGHAGWAMALDEMADVDRREGRFDAALQGLARSQAMRIAVQGADSPDLAFTQCFVARVYVDMGALEQAFVPLAAALAVFERPGMAPSDLAEAELVLARALQPSDPERSRELVAQARHRMPSNVPLPSRFVGDLQRLNLE